MRILEINSVQVSSVVQSCPALCDPMDCSMPGLPVHHQLPKFKLMFKMSILHIAIYRFKAIPIKIPIVFFNTTGTNNSKICMEP